MEEILTVFAIKVASKHFKSDFPIFYSKYFLHIVVKLLGYHLSNSTSDHNSALGEKYHEGFCLVFGGLSSLT